MEIFVKQQRYSKVFINLNIKRTCSYYLCGPRCLGLLAVKRPVNVFTCTSNSAMKVVILCLSV